MVFAFRSRRLLLGLAAALLGGGVIVLTAWAWSLPRIAVEPASQDLGERPQQPIELTYTIRNEGNSPLRIQEVTTTCGCTKASVDQDMIPPGQSTALRVTMDPQQDNLYGNLLRVITIRSNAPATPQVQVDFRVQIRKSDG
jgi:hypothetical protein